MKFFQFEGRDSIQACEDCTVTYAGMHGQCDLCLEQCEDYPDCEKK